MIFDSDTPLGIENAGIYFRKLCSEGKKIEIKEYKPKRTNLQNRYYWAVINFISSETGNDKDYLHEFFRAKYLHYKPFVIFDTYLLKTPSTTELNTKEMTDYIEKIAIFVSDFGLTIPRPEDKDFEQFLNHYEKMI